MNVYIYFIYDAHSDLIKIGSTEHLDRIHSWLQGSRCRTIECVIRAPREYEFALHKQFAQLRIGRVEWFAGSPDLWELIYQLRASGDFIDQEEEKKRKGQCVICGDELRIKGFPVCSIWCFLSSARSNADDAMHNRPWPYPITEK